MSVKTPLISVIINCYNGEEFVSHAIDSILAQTYERFEIIFWDNQSSDRSAEILKKYRDTRIRYCLAPKHTSLYGARNAAVSVSSGCLIAFLDVDDWWHPEKLAIQVPEFDDEKIGAVYSKYWKYNQESQKQYLSKKGRLASGWIASSLLSDYQVGFLTVIVRRSALEKSKLKFDPSFDIIGDFDMMISLALEWKIKCVQSPLAYYRLHSGNLSKSSKEKQISEYHRWLRKIELTGKGKSLFGIKLVKQEVSYMEACLFLEQNNIGDAFRKLLCMKLSLYKFKLIILIVNHVISCLKVKKKSLSI